MYVRMREATREGIQNFRIFAKNVDLYSGALYTPALILCLLGIEAQIPPMKFPFLIPQK